VCARASAQSALPCQPAGTTSECAHPGGTRLLLLLLMMMMMMMMTLQVRTIAADVSKPEACQQLLRQLGSTPITCFVANAGGGAGRGFRYYWCVELVAALLCAAVLIEQHASGCCGVCRSVVCLP
jgi:hypothetical protein